MIDHLFPDEYMFDNLKEGNRGNNDYLDDATNYEDSYEDEDREIQKSHTKVRRNFFNFSN